MSVTLISIIAVFLLSAETLLVPISVYVDKASWVMDACATTLMSVRMGLTDLMQTHNVLTLWDLTNAPAILDSRQHRVDSRQHRDKFVTMLTNA